MHKKTKDKKIKLKHADGGICMYKECQKKQRKLLKC